MTRYDIRLPWKKQPLSLNDRYGNPKVRGLAIKAVREKGEQLVRAAGIPPAQRVRVTLTYFPRDRRRRDEDNLVATSKVLCDAIVRAGVVPDDTPDLMEKPMPVIGPANPKDPHLVLTIEILDPATTGAAT